MNMTVSLLTVATQDAAITNNALHQIREAIAEGDGALAKMLDCYIKDKGENDKTRLDKLEFCYALDQKTLSLLGEQQQEWQRYPSFFYNRPKSMLCASVDPLAQLLSDYLEPEQDTV